MGAQLFRTFHETRGALGSYPILDIFFFALWELLGEEVPADVGVDELKLLLLLDIEPLRSLGDKLEFLLDDREELGLDTWLPFLVGELVTPGIECFKFEEYFDLAGTGLNVFG